MRPLAITGVGARTPVGPGARETFFSVQAKFNAFHESFIVDRTGEGAVLSAIAPLHPRVGEEARLLELAVAALTEALQGVADSWNARHRVGLVLVTPEPGARPSPWSFPASVVQALLERFPRSIGSPRVSLIPGGHTGWVMALEQISVLFAQGQLDACVLGAVDTLCSPRTVEHLDRQCRLRNSLEVEGRVPGEAAAFLVLEPLRPQSRALSQLAAWGEGTPLQGEKSPLPGALLTRATRECLRSSAANNESPGLILSDMDGSKHEALEMAFARFRAFRDQASAASLLHPSESLGDVGAATGPLLMVLATLCLLHGSGLPGGALVATHTPPGHGAVCRVLPEKR
ncbi:hypothetical protein D7X74_07390 [Corallococcus sp. CA047B]|nr:hypothetical protein D7X74_07390 [Corallococcus sp. CA047B]